ncbi:MULTISPECIES: hypothetical protein [Maricaulis]|uniref:hypothetical protein n=1 Tax=Maricaulis TaxID=74317 RepID=UPI000C69B94C|nr:hypothetical protein [Maricaulis sp.]MAC88543.1 hypothetical protein [Maricaulis sp.]
MDKPFENWEREQHNVERSNYLANGHKWQTFGAQMATLVMTSLVILSGGGLTAVAGLIGSIGLEQAQEALPNLRGVAICFCWSLVAVLSGAGLGYAQSAFEVRSTTLEWVEGPIGRRGYLTQTNGKLSALANWCAIFGITLVAIGGLLSMAAIVSIAYSL